MPRNDGGWPPPRRIPPAECDDTCMVCAKRVAVALLVTVPLPRRHCYNCGCLCCMDCIAGFERLPQFGYRRPVPVCVLCEHFMSIRADARNVLGRTSVPILQLHLRLFGVDSAGCVEKPDLVSLVLNSRTSELAEATFRHNLGVLRAVARPEWSVLRANPDERVSATAEAISRAARATLARLGPLSRHLWGSGASSSAAGASSSTARGPSATAGRSSSAAGVSTPTAGASSSAARAPNPAQTASPRPPRDQTPQSASPAPKDLMVDVADLVSGRVQVADLSARQLKAVLRAQSVSFAHALEKSDLRILVDRLVTSLRSETAASPQCCVCFERAINSVLLECGHTVLCHECALEVFKTTRQCPICRQAISRVLRTFAS